MNLPFFIAKRYLFSKKSHNAINIISGISVVGVCVGTMALVIVLSAFNGLSDLVQSLYNSFDPDIEISIKKGKTFDINDEKFQSIKKMNGVAYFTEIVEGNALLRYEDKQNVCVVKGVSKDFKKMSCFDTLITNGSYDINDNNIIIGQGVAAKLNVNIKNEFTPLTVYSPKRLDFGAINPEDGLNELKFFAVGEFGISDEFDYEYTITSIENARELFNYSANEVTSIELGLHDKSKSDEIKSNLQQLLGANFEIKDRHQQNDVLFKTLKSEKLWTFIILFFILIIASLNVIGSLTMLLIEKKKDIKVLHNIGGDKSFIRKIFLIEGVMITGFGMFLGIVLGLIICFLQKQFGIIKFSEGYVIDAYPIAVQLSDILLIIISVLLIGLFAAWYPVKIFTKKQLAY